MLSSISVCSGVRLRDETGWGRHHNVRKQTLNAFYWANLSRKFLRKAVLHSSQRDWSLRSGSGHILKFCELAPGVEWLPLSGPMQHRSHPPGKLLGTPDAAQTILGVAIQQFLATGL